MLIAGNRETGPAKSEACCCYDVDFDLSGEIYPQQRERKGGWSLNKLGMMSYFTIYGWTFLLLTISFTEDHFWRIYTGIFVAYATVYEMIMYKIQPKPL